MVSIFNAIALLVLIRPRIGGIGGRRMAGSLIKILAASAVMGLVCLAVVHYSRSRALNVLAGVPIGAAVFCAVASWLRVRELAR
jgi:peptidoglycan biosynthesis protein MviN/MurJ (putative lipid II flippase)